MSDNESYFLSLISEGLDLWDGFIRRVYETLDYSDKGKSRGEICQTLDIYDDMQVMMAIAHLEMGGYVQYAKPVGIVGSFDGDLRPGVLFTHRKTTREEREAIMKYRKKEKHPMADFSLSFIQPLSKEEINEKEDYLRKETELLRADNNELRRKFGELINQDPKRHSEKERVYGGVNGINQSL